MPHLLLFVVLILGGLFTSMCMVCLDPLGFSEISASRMSHAATLRSIAQQVSLSFGVVLGPPYWQQPPFGMAAMA